MAFYAFLSASLFLIVSNLWVVTSTQNQVYDSSKTAPHRSVALVLGTSRKLSDGRANPYFDNRITTAYNLYTAGKADYIIVSGDNRSKYYNEPAEMRKALIAKGVPSSIITLDFAGLRTFDSIVRCKEIFGQESITIITQPFHSYRSLFISNYFEMDAIVVVAEEPEAMQSLKVLTRELLARPLAILDLYVFNTEPRFLGEKEELNRP
ncbi:SanA protein [Chryseotalea sanaruensis]|uniref:SanA protein n=2 Tax=Chryseotalea sanaruensis TaxID=2482724 RepID=A0A401U5C5_9BACT|nr:SanA protein [Chryseotalea sanaruensis]